ncbi:MAG: hypothetical protein IMF11_17385 [Proteobacteria bacterium]|nr:hypothetical protein [Pseudomonadota bacterium]
MIYKRATKQLQDAGIKHIVIVKRLWGPSPENTSAKRQKSRCFETWQKAAEAVKSGFRPTILEE